MQLFTKHSISTQWVFLAVTGLAMQLFQPIAHAEPSQKHDLQEDIPSRELLEFLVSYGDIDDESFELIIFHGKQDIEGSDVDRQSNNESEKAEMVEQVGEANED